MNEIEQAQAITEIKARQLMRIGSQVNAFGRLTAETHDCKLLLEIVDSQAQKIAEQEKEIERLKGALSTAEWYGEPAPRKIYRPDIATIIPDSAGGVLTDSKEVAR